MVDNQKKCGSGQCFVIDDIIARSFLQKKVSSASLVNKRSRVNVFKVLFTDFIGTSQSPPIQGLLGGLNVQIKLTCL